MMNHVKINQGVDDGPAAVGPGDGVATEPGELLLLPCIRALLCITPMHRLFPFLAQIDTLKTLIYRAQHIFRCTATILLQQTAGPGPKGRAPGTSQRHRPRVQSQRDDDEASEEHEQCTCVLAVFPVDSPQQREEALCHTRAMQLQVVERWEREHEHRTRRGAEEVEHHADILRQHRNCC